MQTLNPKPLNPNPKPTPLNPKPQSTLNPWHAVKPAYAYACLSIAVKKNPPYVCLSNAETLNPKQP